MYRGERSIPAALFGFTWTQGALNPWCIPGVFSRPIIGLGNLYTSSASNTQCPAASVVLQVEDGEEMEMEVGVSTHISI